MNEPLHLYGEIEKFDACADGSLLVTGIASTQDVDADGEIVTADAMRKAIPAYLQSGTVREMHQPIAAGKPISAFVDDAGVTHFTAKVVDPVSIKKVQEGVLKGFSIGGKKIAKIGKQITELLLRDISLVDLPNNSSCVFTLIKFDKVDEKQVPPEKPETEKIMSAELLQKMDTLAATVDVLAKTVETLSKASPPQVKLVTADGKELTADLIAKALTDTSKLVADTQKALETKERGDVISKMESEGRVAFTPASGVAYKRTELEAMPMDILKFAAANSPSIPTQARAIYRGDTAPNAIDPNLKGADKVEAAWEKNYGSLAIAKARFNLSN